MRKAAGEDDGVTIGEVFRLVPDEFDGLLQDVADGVERVVVAIGPGKNDDSKFHAAVAPCGVCGNFYFSTAAEVRRTLQRVYSRRELRSMEPSV